MPNNAIIANRVPGPVQGIMLLLPITMSVAGITVFVATAARAVLERHARRRMGALFDRYR